MLGENEASLTQQLLDITRKMLKTGSSFSLKLSISNFNFSASSTKEDILSDVKKKKYKSPSQKKRDYVRKQNYLKQKLEVPNSKDESEKPDIMDALKMTKNPVTHDRFKCEQCGEKLDTKNCLTTHMISKHNEPGEIFTCDLCEFTTSRRVSLNIHTSMTHKVIEQLDGNDSSSEEVYAKSYWERDQLGTGYQSYLDVIENIESANISNEDKSNETKRAMKAREDAFVKLGQTVESIHSRWPPWS